MDIIQCANCKNMQKIIQTSSILIAGNGNELPIPVCLNTADYHRLPQTTADLPQTRFYGP